MKLTGLLFLGMIVSGIEKPERGKICGLCSKIVERSYQGLDTRDMTKNALLIPKKMRRSS